MRVVSSRFITPMGAAGWPAEVFRNTTSSVSAEAEAQPIARHNVANRRADTAQLHRHHIGPDPVRQLETAHSGTTMAACCDRSASFYSPDLYSRKAPMPQ